MSRVKPAGSPVQGLFPRYLALLKNNDQTPKLPGQKHFAPAV